MPGFWITMVVQGLPIVVNITGSGCNYVKVLNIPEFQICLVSAHANITQGSDYAWIWLFNAWINCSEYGRVLNITLQSFEYDYCCKYASALNVAGFWGCEGYKGCWICLNKLKYALRMLNMLKHACIYLNKQSSEYAKILNVSDTVHSIR